jgi:hypothetical protein
MVHLSHKHDGGDKASHVKLKACKKNKELLVSIHMGITSKHRVDATRPLILLQQGKTLHARFKN